MNTSRFQLSLIALLAAGLGMSVSSSDAIGYPTAAVSKGSNPIWNIGGTPPSTGYINFSVPGDQDLIITDIHFGALNTGWMKLQLEVDGDVVSGFAAEGTADRSDVSLKSGIRIPAGSLLTARFSHIYDINSTQYTLSGYYTQP